MSGFDVFRLSVLVALAVTLAGCGYRSGATAAATGTSRPAPSASPTNAATAQQLVALGEQVFPQISQAQASRNGWTAGLYWDCSIDANSLGSDYSSCPFTDRLKARLSQRPLSLCRGCFTGSPTRSIRAEPSPRGGVIYVTLFNGSQRLELLAIRQGGQLLVDDELCANGDVSTSEYADPTRPAWGCGR